MEEVHGIIGEKQQSEYRLGALGTGTIVLAALLFGYGLWVGEYFLCIAVLLVEAILVFWMQRGERVIRLIHWGVFIGVIFGSIYYILYSQPELFYLLDTHILPHPSEQVMEQEPSRFKNLP